MTQIAVASSSDRQQMLDCFIELCEIESPSGQEREVADFTTDRLKEFGLVVTEDGAAGSSTEGSGNLFTRVLGEDSSRALLMCAHLDTVPVISPIEVNLDDGYYKNLNSGILGADNKSAVAMLIEIARYYSEKKPPITVELLFTSSEEVGLVGAKAFDSSILQSEYGFVFDHATEIGDLIVRAPTHQRVTAEFTGVASHAGIRPEDGRSAIIAAVKAIEEMPHGRINDRTTINVGTIEGGTAINVVAESCKIDVEVRSLDHMSSVEVAREIVDACNWAAGVTITDVIVKVEEDFHAYELRSDDVSVVVAKAALADLGIEANLSETGGGSDANALIQKGFQCLNVANGTEANHTQDERVSVAAMEKMLELGHRIIARASEVKRL